MNIHDYIDIKKRLIDLEFKCARLEENLKISKLIKAKIDGAYSDTSPEKKEHSEYCSSADPNVDNCHICGPKKENPIITKCHFCSKKIVNKSSHAVWCICESCWKLHCQIPKECEHDWGIASGLKSTDIDKCYTEYVCFKCQEKRTVKPSPAKECTHEYDPRFGGYHRSCIKCFYVEKRPEEPSPAPEKPKKKSMLDDWIDDCDISYSAPEKTLAEVYSEQCCNHLDGQSPCEKCKYNARTARDYYMDRFEKASKEMYRTLFSKPLVDYLRSELFGEKE